MPSPSGDQYLLEHGDQRAVVVELGGGVRSYEAGGRPILDGYPLSEPCAGGRGQVLAPWPNRVGDGRWRWDGVERQLALTEPAAGNAIHGLVRWVPWRRESASPRRVRLTHRCHPQPGWSWIVDLALEYRLGDEGLTVALEAINRSGEPCPFAVGFHPYLAAFGGPVDDAVLRLPAASWYEADGRGLPVGRHRVDGGPLDFRDGRAVGAAVLDTALGDLGRDDAGRVEVVLEAGDGSDRTSLWMDGAFTHVMLFTGDTLADTRRRRRGLAVEPMTAPVDALRSGEGLVVLHTDEVFRASWGVRPG